jgi:hypothetical protein
MKRLVPLILSTAVIFLYSSAVSAEEAEDWPPRNGGPAIAMILGPEGYGGGLGWAFWDLGKEGRDLFLYPIFADTDYRLYFMDYREPGLLRPEDGENLSFRAFYQKRTGTHFFGVGPEAEIEDGAFYQRENYLFKLEYTCPFTKHFGAAGSIGYDRTVARASTLDLGDLSFEAELPELDRPLDEVYPWLFDSREFRDEYNHFWSVSLWFDNQKGPRGFPTGGGHLKGSASRIDEAQSADWNYWRYTIFAAMFAPVSDDYNIIGLHLRWDRLDGGNVPFYKLPSLGQARFSTGYVLDGNAMRGVWENLWADRNRALASVEYRHRVKAGWYPDDLREMEFPFEFDPEEFVRNAAWFGWVDAGQVWPDDEELEDLRTSLGIGAVLYFANGMSQQITLGFSDDLSAYMLFTYGMQF